MTAREGFPFVYLHSCGRPAFYLREMPTLGEQIRSANVMGTDGEKPIDHTEITCGSCGASIPDLSSSNASLAT